MNHFNWEADSKGNKVIVVTSDDYYKSIAPIKILQPNETVDRATNTAALCNRVVVGSKGKDKVVTNLTGCDTCLFNRPTSSSHACGYFSGGSEKPVNKQVNILRKGRSKTPSKKRRSEDFSIEVGQDVAKRTALPGKIQKRSCVKKSLGPRSTASLVKDATRKTNVAVIDLTNSDVTSSVLLRRKTGGNFPKPILQRDASGKVPDSSYLTKPASTRGASRNVVINFPLKEASNFVDICDPAFYSSAGPSQTPTQDLDIAFSETLDETLVLDEINQRYGTSMDAELLGESLSSNLTSSPPMEDSAPNHEIQWNVSGYQMQQELLDQLELPHDTENSIEVSSNSTETLFTLHQLKKLPGKIFDSPKKTKGSASPTDVTISNIPTDFLEKHSNIDLSTVTLDEIHSSVEIKKEIISDNLVDDDILEVFEVFPDNGLGKQLSAMDPSMCLTFEDVENSANNILVETKQNDSNGASNTLKLCYENFAKSTNDSARSESTPPIKLWEMSSENIDLDVDLGEFLHERQNNQSPYSELFEVLNNSLSYEEPKKDEDKLEKLQFLLKNILIDSSELAVLSEGVPDNKNFAKHIKKDLQVIDRNAELIKKTHNELETTDSRSLSLENISEPKVKVDNIQILKTMAWGPQYENSNTNTADLIVPELSESIITEDNIMGSVAVSSSETKERVSETKVVLESVVGASSETKESVSGAKVVLGSVVVPSSEAKESVAGTKAVLGSIVPSSKIKETASKSTQTSPEASRKYVPERNVNALDVIRFDHSYGINVSKDVTNSSCQPPQAGNFPVPVSDNIITEATIEALQPIIEESNVRELKNVSQDVKSVTKEENASKIETEFKLENVTFIGQEKASTEKKLVPEDCSTYASSIPPVVPINMFDETSTVKTKIKEYAEDLKKKAEAPKAKILQEIHENTNLEQQKHELKDYITCLMAKIEIPKETCQYLQEIVGATLKDIDVNAKPDTIARGIKNLLFVEQIVNQMVYSCDYKAKNISCKVISITRKEEPQKQIVPVRKAPAQPTGRTCKRRVKQNCARLLKKVCFRLKKVWELGVWKMRVLRRRRKLDTFVSTIKKVGKKDLCNGVALKSIEGEKSRENAGRLEEKDLGVAQTSQTGVVPIPLGEELVIDSSGSLEETKSAIELSQTDVEPSASSEGERKEAVKIDLSDSLEEMNLIQVKPVKGKQILSSIENLPKITPMNREIKVIFSQIDNTNESESKRETNEEIYMKLLEKGTGKISKSVGKGTPQDILLKNDKGNEETLELSNNFSDGKNFGNRALKKEAAVENNIKRRGSRQSNSYEKQSECIENFNSFSSRSRRASRKPAGYYAESKMFIQASSDDSTSMVKYQIDCSNIDVTQSTITKCIDLAYELKNDDKPCVILYNKNPGNQSPIIKNLSPRRERRVIDEPLAVAGPSKVPEYNESKILEIKITDELATRKPRGARKKPEPVAATPRMSLRSTTMKEKNAVKESTKTSKGNLPDSFQKL